MNEIKEITVKNKKIRIGDIVETTEGKAKLDYISRKTFTRWTLIEQTEVFIFGKPIIVEDNNLDSFIL